MQKLPTGEHRTVKATASRITNLGSSSDHGS